MGPDRFAPLSLGVARLGTRRGLTRLVLRLPALAALLLGAGAVAEADASDHPVRGVQQRADKRRDRKHHRLKQKRRQRRRNQNQNQDSAPGNWAVKGISILLQNPAGARSTPHLEVVKYLCAVGFGIVCGCQVKAVFDIAPGGGDRVFDTDETDIVVQINRKYSISFHNSVFVRPWITGSITHDNNLCHTTEPTLVLDNYHMDEGESFTFALDGHRFTVTRNGDKPDFKYFTLQLATDL